MSRTSIAAAVAALLCVTVLTRPVPGQAPVLGYDDTPMQPNGKWRVHDSHRPHPRVVTPASTPAAAPSDATVLLGADGDLSHWKMRNGSPISWKVDAGVLESSKGDIETKLTFSDFQLHIEWATPTPPKGDSQNRGNSGVFLLGVFELQVLDSFNNPTYSDGQAAAFYGQFPPLVNASRGPGQWQSYDIVFTAPRFEGSKLTRPATGTVFHNGIVVHNATAFWGATAHKRIGPYTPEMSKGPIALQDHENPVHFRNIWIRTLTDYDAG